MTSKSPPDETGTPPATWIDFLARHWLPAAGLEGVPIWERLAGDGSDRTFHRVSLAGRSAVVLIGADRDEDRAYAAIGRHLWRLGRWGPEILAADLERGFFLIEDLGSTSLWDYLERASTDEREEAYRRVLALLADFHHRGLDGFNPDWAFQTRSYDLTLILERETGYFLKAFVQGFLGRPVAPEFLGDEFRALARSALEGTETVLMHRDFQSRNVMIRDGRPRLIDFQGARLGPPGYDLASLAHDPYVAPWFETEPDWPNRLAEWYIELRTGQPGFDPSTFRAGYPFLAVCRLLQALGAYGFLTKVKGKPGFARHIPAAVRSLDHLLERPEFWGLPRLKGLIREIRLENI